MPSYKYELYALWQYLMILFYTWVDQVIVFQGIMKITKVEKVGAF